MIHDTKSVEILKKMADYITLISWLVEHSWSTLVKHTYRYI